MNAISHQNYIIDYRNKYKSYNMHNNWHNLQYKVCIYKSNKSSKQCHCAMTSISSSMRENVLDKLQHCSLEEEDKAPFPHLISINIFIYRIQTNRYMATPSHEVIRQTIILYNTDITVRFI